MILHNHHLTRLFRMIHLSYRTIVSGSTSLLVLKVILIALPNSKLDSSAVFTFQDTLHRQVQPGHWEGDTSKHENSVVFLCDWLHCEKCGRVHDGQKAAMAYWLVRHNILEAIIVFKPTWVLVCREVEGAWLALFQTHAPNHYLYSSVNRNDTGMYKWNGSEYPAAQDWKESSVFANYMYTQVAFLNWA